MKSKNNAAQIPEDIWRQRKYRDVQCELTNLIFRILDLGISLQGKYGERKRVGGGGVLLKAEFEEETLVCWGLDWVADNEGFEDNTFLLDGLCVLFLSGEMRNIKCILELY